MDDLKYFKRCQTSVRRNKKIFRLLCCGFALFMMAIIVISYYDVGFQKEGKLFYFRDRNYYNGFFLLQGESGIEIWESGLNDKGWVSEYRIFP